MAYFKVTGTAVSVYLDDQWDMKMGTLQSGIIIEGEIVKSGATIRPTDVNTEYVNATVLKIKYYPSQLTNSSPGLTMQNLQTGYCIMQYITKLTAEPKRQLEPYTENDSDDDGGGTALENSGSGTYDPLKEETNGTYILPDLEVLSGDSEEAFYFSHDLYENGLVPESTAKTVATALERLGGSSKVSMRLFGMPYQFMPSVDSRLSSLSSRIGVQFLKNIISEAAILKITPGIPKYMGNFGGSSQTKTAWLIKSTQSLNNIFNTQVNPDQQLKYYDFEEDYISYMKYVNMMCRSAAGFMGLDSVPVDSEISTLLARMDWKQYRFDGIGYDTLAGTLSKDIGNALVELANSVGNGVSKFCSKLCDSLSSGKDPFSSMADAWDYATTNKTTANYNGDAPNSPASVGTTDIIVGDNYSEEETFGDKFFNYLGINENYVQFMIEPSSFSESSENETMESQLLSTINDSLGNTIKEVRFIAGTAGANGLMDMADSASQSILDALGSMGGNTSTNIVARVTGSMGKLLSGDRMVFPEIFNKSAYRKSYNVSIKLKSPYGDRYSYYINILVPLFHLIALAAPRQTSGNTYDSPFLIRAFLPGMWQCNMGIIKQLQIERNGSDGLSVDGYPLELTVTLTIDDLYSDLMITPTTNPSLFMCNTGLVDFIMIQCGLDVTNKNYSAKLQNAVIDITGKYKDIFGNVSDAVNQDISHGLLNFFSGVMPMK